MVNIIPQQPQQLLRVRYYARLFTTFFLLVTGILLVSAGLLAPSYFLAREEATAAARHADALEQKLALEGKASAGQTVSVLDESVSLLKTYQRDPVITSSLAAVVTALPSGVTLQNISVVVSDSAPGTVKLSGIAETRANLVSFVNALQGKNMFKNVSVPVSDLANETDLDFSLSFAISPVLP